MKFNEDSRVKIPATAESAQRGGLGAHPTPRLAAADADERAGDGGDYRKLNFETWNYEQQNHTL